jgi:hypothetical protein
MIPFGLAVWAYRVGLHARSAVKRAVTFLITTAKLRRCKRSQILSFTGKMPLENAARRPRAQTRTRSDEEHFELELVCLPKSVFCRLWWRPYCQARL